MLDYLIGTALILLLIGHALLIRGCFAIGEHLVGVGDLPDNLSGVTDLLGRSAEALDFIADILNEQGNSQTAPAPPGGLLGAFLGSMMMPQHGRTSEQEWAVHQVERDAASSDA